MKTYISKIILSSTIILNSCSDSETFQKQDISEIEIVSEIINEKQRMDVDSMKFFGDFELFIADQILWELENMDTINRIPNSNLFSKKDASIVLDRVMNYQVGISSISVVKNNERLDLYLFERFASNANDTIWHQKIRTIINDTAQNYASNAYYEFRFWIPDSLLFE